METATAVVEGRLVLGKLSRNLTKTGTRNCEAALTWELKDGTFSAQGEVWNHIKTDIVAGGQMVDTLADLFPHNAKAQRIKAIWERWHLNDMLAACVHQRERGETWATHPSAICPDCGYSLGSAGLREELPTEVVAEILSWSA